MPDLFFGNLVHLWNNVYEGDVKLERDGSLAWVNAHVYISGYRMRSAKRDIRKREPVVGALGNATYRVTKLNTNYYTHVLEEIEGENENDFIVEDYSANCQWLHVLCELGTYTNVGGNRTASMGVIRYWVKNTLSENDLPPYS